MARIADGGRFDHREVIPASRTAECDRCGRRKRELIPYPASVQTTVCRVCERDLDAGEDWGACPDASAANYRPPMTWRRPRLAATALIAAGFGLAVAIDLLVRVVVIGTLLR